MFGQRQEKGLSELKQDKMRISKITQEHPILSGQYLKAIQNKQMLLANSFSPHLQIMNKFLYQLHLRESDQILVEQNKKIRKVCIKSLMSQQTATKAVILDVINIKGNKLIKIKMRIQKIQSKEICFNNLHKIKIATHKDKTSSNHETSLIIQSDNNLWTQKDLIYQSLNVFQNKNRNKKYINTYPVFSSQKKSKQGHNHEYKKETSVYDVEKSIPNYQIRTISKINIQRNPKEQILYKMVPIDEEYMQNQCFIIVNDLVMKYRQIKSYFLIRVYLNLGLFNVSFHFILNLTKKNTLQQIKKRLINRTIKVYKEIKEIQLFQDYSFYDSQYKQIDEKEWLSKYQSVGQIPIFFIKRSMKKYFRMDNKSIVVYNNAVLFNYQKINIKKDKTYQNLQIGSIKKEETIIDSRQFEPTKDVQTLFKVKTQTKTKYYDFIKFSYNKGSKQSPDIKTFVSYRYNYILYAVEKKADYYQSCTALDLKQKIQTKQKKYFLFTGSGKTYEILQCLTIFDDRHENSRLDLLALADSEQNDPQKMIIVNDIKLLNKSLLTYNIRILIVAQQSQQQFKFGTELIVDYCYDEIKCQSFLTLLMNFKFNKSHVALYNNQTFNLSSKIQNIFNKTSITDIAYIFIVHLPHLNHNIHHQERHYQELTTKDIYIRRLSSQQHVKSKESNKDLPIKQQNIKTRQMSGHQLPYQRIRKRLYYTKCHFLTENQAICEQKYQQQRVSLSYFQDKEHTKGPKLFYERLGSKMQWEQIQPVFFRTDKIVVWVDDNPENNLQIINEIKEESSEDIQIVQICSTQPAIEWIYYFYPYLKWLRPNCQIKLITDMKRGSDCEAGANLISQLVDLNIKVDFCVFTGHKQECLRIISRRENLKATKIKISEHQTQLNYWLFKEQNEPKTIYDEQKNSKCHLI